MFNGDGSDGDRSEPDAFAFLCHGRSPGPIYRSSLELCSYEPVRLPIDVPVRPRANKAERQAVGAILGFRVLPRDAEPRGKRRPGRAISSQSAAVVSRSDPSQFNLIKMWC